MIHNLCTGDKVHKYQKGIVIQFQGKRKVLSTSFINGGYREDIKNVFNYDENPGVGIACTMRGNTYKEHFLSICEELGLDTKTTAGISTAASMDNVAIVSEKFKELQVTAIVTGGIEVNGGRVGDPSSYYENNGKFESIAPGTINIILVINANMPSETMVRALVTCTEAKTAAIQELMEGSKYSRGIATGSGTDGTIIISNSQSKLEVLFAGKHAKLGELIGIAVKKAVKKALFLQSGLCAKKQHSMLRRFKRFKVNEQTIWEKYNGLLEKGFYGKEYTALSKADFINNLESIDTMDEIVTLSCLYTHLLDELDWNLLSIKEVVYEGNIILERIKNKFNVSYVEGGLNIDNCKDVDGTINNMINEICTLMAIISGGNNHE